MPLNELQNQCLKLQLRHDGVETWERAKWRPSRHPAWGPALHPLCCANFDLFNFALQLSDQRSQAPLQGSHTETELRSHSMSRGPRVPNASNSAPTNSGVRKVPCCIPQRQKTAHVALTWPGSNANCPRIPDLIYNTRAFGPGQGPVASSGLSEITLKPSE